MAFAQDDDTAPEIFLSGIVSTDSLEFGNALSPDGSTFYFCRSVQKRTRIFATRKSNNHWSKPEPVAFSSIGYSDADPAFSPSGDLYFISNRPTSERDTTIDYDIWKVTPLPERHWSEPINVKALNSEKNEFYVSFAKNGDACFSSSRDGGYGAEDIYMSAYEDNAFGIPVNAGNEINSLHSEYDPFVTPDGSGLIFTSSGRKDSFGKADLYWSVKLNGIWLSATHFGLEINSPTRDFCPYITPDRTHFFYSTHGDIKFITTQRLPAPFRSTKKN